MFTVFTFRLHVKTEIVRGLPVHARAVVAARTFQIGSHTDTIETGFLFSQKFMIQTHLHIGLDVAGAVAAIQSEFVDAGKIRLVIQKVDGNRKIEGGIGRSRLSLSCLCRPLDLRPQIWHILHEHCP